MSMQMVKKAQTPCKRGQSSGKMQPDATKKTPVRVGRAASSANAIMTERQQL
jgi:hypothetical protein